jgi:hypothetical protein
LSGTTTSVFPATTPIIDSSFSQESSERNEFNASASPGHYGPWFNVGFYIGSSIIGISASPVGIPVPAEGEHNILETPIWGEVKYHDCSGKEVVQPFIDSTVIFTGDNVEELQVAFASEFLATAVEGYWQFLGTCNCINNPADGSPRWDSSPNQRMSNTVNTHDPNDLIGPAGYGDAAFVQGDSSLSYEVRFENDPNATAPARLVSITDTLDPNLDLNTFELTEIDFGSQRIVIPQGLDSYGAMIPMTTPTGVAIEVNVQAKLDRTSRTLSLALQALDPTTGTYPEDPLIGLLYPEDGTNRGTGSISYLVKPVAGLPTGTEINNQAQVVFDYNDPIDTPLVHNTLDSAAPTSRVAPLPATTSDTTLHLNWAGQDETGGSGIAAYTIYESVDGGPALAVFTDTTETSGGVTVEPGHTYAFYSIATDNVGHQQATPATPDTTINVQQVTSLSTISGSDTYGGAATLTATLTSGGSPLAGKAVAFALSDGTKQTMIGSATTDASGVAKLSDVNLPAFNAGTFSGAVLATFAGDATDVSSTGSGDLTVNPVQATLSFGNQVFTYDGTPHLATVGTSPAGLTGVAVTYTQNNVAVDAPTGAGTYTVMASLNNPNASAPTATDTLTVNPAMPTITWANPADISYGTPLTATQLDATASVPGTFVYTPAAGTTLHAGQGQVLSIIFTPTDAIDYAPVTTTAMINVQKATPAVTWTNPADITYGTALSATQLDATASVPGTLVYTPAAGTVLNAGPGQVLSVTLTPTDAVDFSPVTTTAAINVRKATPTVTWANPADVVYGTALGAAQFDATAPVPGMFTYAPVPGTYLGAGQAQTLHATFTPDDPADYNTVPVSTSINVVPAPLTVTADDASMIAGQSLPTFAAHYSGFVRGEEPDVLGGVLSLSVPSGTGSQAGSYPITPAGLTSSNYAISYQTGTLTVSSQPVSPTALVTVQSVQWQSEKLSRHKTAKVLVVTFSGALNANDAQNTLAYNLVAAGKDKRFGTKDDKPVKIASAAYNSGANTVTLKPKGTVPNQTLQLTIPSGLVLDLEGRQIDGNRDGQPSGNFVGTFGKQGISLASVPQSGLMHAVSANALDALLVADILPSQYSFRHRHRQDGP